MSDGQIRILVVEDNFLTRHGTVMVLETQPDFAIVGQAEDGPAGLAAFRELHPDVVIVDLRMPGYDGAQLTAAIVKEQPPGRVLVLSHYDGDEDVRRALRAGATGYVTKEVHGAELFQAVRAVARGERYLPSALAVRLADSVLQAPLTPRELQTLHAIHRGLSNKEIAAELAISERTVAMFVSNVLAKLSAKNRAEAVAIGLKRGILQTD